MSTSAPAPPAVVPRQPEEKFGPFAGGISVVIWKNIVGTEDGPREIRSITINPRRYRDEQSGEWKNGSYRTGDLPVLILALQAAQQFIARHPLEQSGEDEPPETQHGEGTPF